MSTNFQPSVTSTSSTPASEQAEVAALRTQLEQAQAAHVSALMERNFLKRAMADLNFHHNAHDGIVYTDTQNRVVYANPYFLKMMKIEDPAEILGKPLPVYMWEQPTDEGQLFADVKQYGFVRERELSLYNRDREPVFVACSSVASKDDFGKFIGTEIMLCNITTKRKIQAQLAQRTQSLERVTEFTRESLTTLTELVKRGATRQEMLDILTQMSKQLEATPTS